jgi:hypothetical protein
MRKVPCEVYSRVVGYFRPITNWNDGKKQEFFDRKMFSEKDSLNTKVELITPQVQCECVKC